MKIDIIRETHRRRQDLHRAEKSLTIQIRAICRRLCACMFNEMWKAGEITEAEYRKHTKAEADKLYDAMVKEVPHPLYLSGMMNTAQFFEARDGFTKARLQIEKQLERHAKALPIASWAADLRGLGMGSLAAIVGEAGDLANYSTHSKLWKRLGLAVIDGQRQRCVTGDAAHRHGYSPVRRSIIWNIGQCVLKAQSQRLDKETGEILKPAGHYREVYDKRKAYELARDIPKGHAHNRATRYMEKLVIRDLWKAWRALSATLSETEGAKAA